MMTHHLVTGGGGFIGSALAKRLVEHGDYVTVLDRFSRGKERRVPLAANVVKADIRIPYAVEKCVQRADVIWHLAYIQGTQTFYAEPRTVIDVALTGMMNVLHAAERAGHKPDLVLVSSSEVYQNPPDGMFPTGETVPLSVPDVTNPRYSYGAGKIACEVATLAYADVLGKAVIVRPHNVYGPDMGFEHVIPQFAVRMGKLLKARSRAFKIQGTGRETRSFCYIDDCVDGLIVAHDHGEDRGIYHLGNPAEEHTIREVAFRVANWFGVDIDLVPTELPKGSPTRRLPDIAKLQALGYQPTVTLDDGLDPTLFWYAHLDGEMEAA